MILNHVQNRKRGLVRAFLSHLFYNVHIIKKLFGEQDEEVTIRGRLYNYTVKKNQNDDESNDFTFEIVKKLANFRL